MIQSQLTKPEYFSIFVKVSFPNEKIAMKQKIIFIHGMFMNPKCWEEWIPYFENKGYECIVPAWPFHEGNPADLRKNIPAGLGKLTLDEVVNKISDIINAMNEPPILIGHSMGGLVVQLLISKGKGKMGICIDSAAPNGMLTFKWSFFKSNLPAINPLKGSAPALMTPEHFHYTFCNTMTMNETRTALDKYVVPESRNVPRSSTKAAGKIDMKKAHAPLLFIAGEKDNIIPESLNRKNFNAYSDTLSKKEFKVFEGRTHFICGQKNWQEVAEYCAEWIRKN